MVYETKIVLIILFSGVALAFLVMLIAIITSKFKRDVLEKENLLQAVENRRQIELFSATTKAEESQKVKIASNLHDQILPILLINTRNLINYIADQEKQGLINENLNKTAESLAQLSDNIREIAHDLIPKLFTSFGLIKSIEVFIRDMNTSGESVADFRNNTTFSGELPFTQNDQLIIYRISLEILNNLYKHSRYDYLTVSIEDVSDNFVLLFSHNGKGISNEEIMALRESGKGIGLKSLHSRALILNAKIDYFRDSDVSYVRLTVPIKK